MKLFIRSIFEYILSQICIVVCSYFLASIYFMYSISSQLEQHFKKKDLLFFVDKVMIWNAFTSQFCKLYIALSNHKECVDWND